MINPSLNEMDATKAGMIAGYEYAASNYPEIALALSKLSTEQMIEIGLCITGGFTDEMQELTQNDIPF